MAGADSVLSPPAARRTVLPAGQSTQGSGAAAGGLRWTGLFALLLLVGLASLGMFLFSSDWTNMEGSLPVGLRSPLFADYSADPFDNSAFAPLSTAILAEAISDREQAKSPVDGQIATIMDDLRTPVPSITPQPSLTPAATNSFARTDQPVLPPWSGTASPTAPVQPTRAASPTLRPTMTPTLLPTHSLTPWPTSTPKHTATHAQPTSIVHTAVPPTSAPTETAQPPIFRPSATSGTINTPLPHTPEPTSPPVVPTSPPPAPTEEPEEPYPPPNPLPTEEPPSYPYP